MQTSPAYERLGGEDVESDAAAVDTAAAVVGKLVAVVASALVGKHAVAAVVGMPLEPAVAAARAVLLLASVVEAVLLLELLPEEAVLP